MVKKLLFICFMLSITIIPVSASEKVAVFVSILPQKYFVEEIGKDRVDVKVMVKPGAGPHTYEPKPSQMANISKTKIYFSIGVPFENTWLKKFSSANPDMKIVHTDRGIDKIPMEAHHHHDDHVDKEHHGDHYKDHHDKDHAKHGHMDEEHHRHHDCKSGEHKHNHHDCKHHKHHGHEGLDPHIWTSPKLVKIQAKRILRGLQKADPANKKEYEKNFEKFAYKIDLLDKEIKETLKGKKGLQFMVFHPAWGYFAKAYGLKQIPIEIEGKNPKPAQLRKLIEHAKEENIKIIFVQPQFSTKSAKVVAKEIGGEVAFADPLAGDWMGNLKMIAAKFKAALK